MLPVLFTIGEVPVSSLGVFLVLALFYAMLLVWRLARAWDLDEEKILDLTFITSFGAFIGARVYFVLQYFNYFGLDLAKIFAIFKYPGFSFWGAFLGGWLTLHFATRRSKIDFAQILDIASVGFLGALILGDLGCFLGGCDVGVISSFGVSMVGQIGKRFPVQLLEAIAVGILLLRIWSKATHFHSAGSIASLSLIWVGIIKFVLEFFRGFHNGGYLFSLVVIALGISLHYRFSKRKFKQDLAILAEFLQRVLMDSRFRNAVLQTYSKNWYNGVVSSLHDNKIAIGWRFRNLRRILKKINVKPTTKNP